MAIETECDFKHTKYGPEYNRLWWHSRRGMLELDVLLVPFTEQGYPQLSASNQAKYRRLLTCEDPDLFQWIMGHAKPDDPDLQDIVKLIVNRTDY